jgi:hypothetical protein
MIIGGFTFQFWKTAAPARAQTTRTGLLKKDGADGATAASESDEKAEIVGSPLGLMLNHEFRELLGVDRLDGTSSYVSVFQKPRPVRWIAIKFLLVSLFDLT